MGTGLVAEGTAPASGGVVGRDMLANGLGCMVLMGPAWSRLPPPAEEDSHDSEISECIRSGSVPVPLSCVGLEPAVNSGRLNGIEKIAVVPLSSLDSSDISPFIKSTKFLEMVRPSPVPPNRRAVLESA